MIESNRNNNKDDDNVREDVSNKNNNEDEDDKHKEKNSVKFNDVEDENINEKGRVITRSKSKEMRQAHEKDEISTFYMNEDDGQERITSRWVYTKKRRQMYRRKI